MAVDMVVGCYRGEGHMAEDAAVKEAASEGIQSMERLLRILSQQQDTRAAAELEMDAVTKFKKVISLLGRTRTGHARFRRALPCPPPASTVPNQVESPATFPASDSSCRVYCPTPISRLPPPPPHPQLLDQADSIGREIGFQVVSVSAGRPPLSGSTSLKRKPCGSSRSDDVSISISASVSAKCVSSSSGRCHCSKKR